jgi:ADP-dependent NAD(P)H-hydrate dehydratase / NAD(P)H-hydrate epimerase
MWIANGPQMRELDRRTIEEIGLPGMVLMECAGRGVVEAMIDHFGDLDGLSVGVLCGTGNNGGDGFVVARHLWNRGVEVEVFLLGSGGRLQGDALANFQILQNLDIPVPEVTNEAQLDELEPLLEECDLVVDALFGTGLTRPLEGFFAKVVATVNRLGAPVIAVDMPSGLSSDSPLHIGKNVTADLTVTFGLPKIGNYFYPARKDVGELFVVDIGIPDYLIEEAEIGIEEVSLEQLRQVILPRDPEGHKGNYGHLLVVAGSRGMTGAAVLASRAGAAAGTGLVTLACPREVNDILEMHLTEVMTLPVPGTGKGCFARASFEAIDEFAAKTSALAVGPGIRDAEDSFDLVAAILTQVERPVVLDADGINVLAGRAEVLRQRWKRMDPETAPVILTPHPGEMARLMGVSVSEIQNDRLGMTLRLADEYQVHVLLKGAQSLVATPDGDLYVNPTGNPGMATGGVGDVLTGFIGGLLAQRVSAAEAAITGVFLHGLAGDLAMARARTVALRAEHLLDPLARLLARLTNGGNHDAEDEAPAGHEPDHGEGVWYRRVAARPSLSGRP